jgi:hypothetical protein
VIYLDDGVLSAVARELSFISDLKNLAMETRRKTFKSAKVQFFSLLKFSVSVVDVVISLALTRDPYHRHSPPPSDTIL